MVFKGLVLIGLAAIIEQQTMIATTIGASETETTGVFTAGWVALLVAGLLYLIVGVLQLLSRSQSTQGEKP